MPASSADMICGRPSRSSVESKLGHLVNLQWASELPDMWFATRVNKRVGGNATTPLSAKSFGALIQV